MRKIVSRIGAIAVLVTLFIACDNDNRSVVTKENMVEFDTLQAEQKYYLHNDTLNPYCDLKVHFIYPIKSAKSDLTMLQKMFVRNVFGQKYDHETPEKALQLYSNSFVKNYKIDARTFKNDREAIEHYTLLMAEEGQKPIGELQIDTFYSYKEMLVNKIHFNKNDLLSYQVSRINNKGRAANYSSYNNYVINLNNGRRLTENDIFKAGYDHALQQLFEKKLLQQNNVKTVSDLEDLGYFGIEEIMPNGNFLIDENGITYIFNKGEYSAYLLDATHIFISLEEVRMLIKKNTIVSKLLAQQQ